MPTNDAARMALARLVEQVSGDHHPDVYTDEFAEALAEAQVVLAAPAKPATDPVCGTCGHYQSTHTEGRCHGWMPAGVGHRQDMCDCPVFSHRVTSSTPTPPEAPQTDAEKLQAESLRRLNIIRRMAKAASFRLGIDPMPEWFMDRVSSRQVTLQGGHPLDRGSLTGAVIRLGGTILQAQRGDRVTLNNIGELGLIREDPHVG